MAHDRTRNFDAELDALEAHCRVAGTTLDRVVAEIREERRGYLLTDVLMATLISLVIFGVGIAVSSACMQ